MRSFTFYFILFYTNDVTEDIKSFQKIYTFALVQYIIAELHDAKCLWHGKLRQKSPKKWDLYSATLVFLTWSTMPSMIDFWICLHLNYTFTLQIFDLSFWGKCWQTCQTEFWTNPISKRPSWKCCYHCSSEARGWILTKFHYRFLVISSSANWISDQTDIQDGHYGSHLEKMLLLLCCILTKWYIQMFTCA